MGDITQALTAAAEQHSALSLIGFMTVSLMLALVFIALIARFIRMFGVVKEYDAALVKLEAIEEQLAQMTENLHAVERDYAASLADEKAGHDREVFSLQQIIFDRNNEILALRASINELNRQYGDYPYDVPPV